MDEKPEIIRQQTEEMRSQLSEKLESLGHQVSETVQSTGTAVNATVEAVQVTVETITEAVQDATRFASRACDIRRQIERHPFMMIGTCFALGYLASELVYPKSAERSVAIQPISSPSASGAGTLAAEIAAAYESGRSGSLWYQTMGAVVTALGAVMQAVASQAGPLIVDHLIGPRKPYDGSPASGGIIRTQYE